MSQKELAGKLVDFDEEGFMSDPSQWDTGVADALAMDEGITLTPDHYKVIDYIRAEFDKKGVVPSLRSIGKKSGVNMKDLYKLFPDGPAKKAARIAGMGKPKGCI